MVNLAMTLHPTTIHHAHPLTKVLTKDLKKMIAKDPLVAHLAHLATLVMTPILTKAMTKTLILKRSRIETSPEPSLLYPRAKAKTHQLRRLPTNLVSQTLLMAACLKSLGPL